MYKEKNLNLSDVKNILKAYAKVLKKHNISISKDVSLWIFVY